MIELTSSYKSTLGQKFLINPRHIIHVAPSVNNHPSYENVKCYVECIGGTENQVAYIQETYEQVKEMLNEKTSSRSPHQRVA